MKPRRELLQLLTTFAALTSPATATIVGGTSGTGNNNNTEAGLVTHLSSTPLSPFPYWNNLVRVADASGVYLGYNASTMRGWVLSANHVTTPANITVDGISYSVTAGSQIGTSDLKLYEINGTPNLAAVSSASSAAIVTESSLMFGRGFTNDTTAPFDWETPGTNDANGTRWATNTVENIQLVDIDSGPGLNLQPYIMVDFDGPGDIGVTAYDGQAALGDSGGGLFIHRGGAWELAGITHFVSSPDQIANPSNFGDSSAYSDVFAKQTSIQGITGTLIPEPAVSLLLPATALLLMRRKRSGSRE
ncbi:MAG: hypothetical protein V4733_02475 [Verrucomicrobiota bacterium]